MQGNQPSETFNGHRGYTLHAKVKSSCPYSTIDENGKKIKEPLLQIPLIDISNEKKGTKPWPNP